MSVTTKKGLHPRNQHKGRYDFDKLTKALPELSAHVRLNPKGEKSIDFSNPLSVKLLNKSLLAHHYGVTSWDIPDGFLCPPIPGRADYVHRLAELLGTSSSVKALDIGTGANAIYPIIGITEYDWYCVASDVDPISVRNAAEIANRNAVLNEKLELRLQQNSTQIFKSIIREGEYYDVTLCNPPFHKSLQEAIEGNQRKQANLSKSRVKRGDKQPTPQRSAELNFGGQKAELWCKGGEAAFIRNMALESKEFAKQVGWFSSLISKKENVRPLRRQLEKLGAKSIQVVQMEQGQKVSRFVAWSYIF